MILSGFLDQENSEPFSQVTLGRLKEERHIVFNNTFRCVNEVEATYL